MLDTRTEDRDLAAVALAALLEHPDTWTRVDERLLEALMAYALNSIDGFAERLGLPADARFDLGRRGGEADVMGRVAGEAVGAIEVKVHSNLNWSRGTEAWQLDNYAARLATGAPLLLLTSEQRAERLRRELVTEDVLSRDRWEMLLLGDVLAALRQCVPQPQPQPGVERLITAVARLASQ